MLTRDRNPALPDVPTLYETVMPGYHILAWAGMFGPAGMPPDVVKTLAAAVHKALDNPEVRQRFASSGTDVYWSDTEDSPLSSNPSWPVGPPWSRKPESSRNERNRAFPAH